MCLKEGRSIEAGGLAAAEFVLGPVRKKKLGIETDECEGSLTGGFLC